MIDLDLDFSRECHVDVVCGRDGRYSVVASLRQEIEDWCAQTLSGAHDFNFDLTGMAARFWISFENDVDAVLFKLRWK